MLEFVFESFVLSNYKLASKDIYFLVCECILNILCSLKLSQSLFFVLRMCQNRTVYITFVVVIVVVVINV